MRRLALATFVALPLLAWGCAGAPAPAQARKPAVAPPPSVLHVTYREAANVFEILDNLSGWLDGKCDVEYREYWQKRFGITAGDDERFRSYKQIRERYYTSPEDEPGALFARAKPPDRLAAAFYEAANLDAAFTKLATFMKADEIAVLKAFQSAYRPQYELLLAESAAFIDMARAMDAKLSAPRASAYYASVARFYGVTDSPEFTVLYVWWPPVDNTTANNRDTFLLLKYNPIKDREEAQQKIEIPVHEYTHYISAHQPAARRVALENVFKGRCDVSANISRGKILEEPMAVVHQKMFLSFVDPERLDFANPWYGGDPWISTFSKLIYDQVLQSHLAGKRLDETLMKGVGKSCAQLKAVAAAFR